MDGVKEKSWERTLRRAEMGSLRLSFGLEVMTRYACFKL